jgi:hypothetical protein
VKILVAVLSNGIEMEKVCADIVYASNVIIVQIQIETDLLVDFSGGAQMEPRKNIFRRDAHFLVIEIKKLRFWHGTFIKRRTKFDERSSAHWQRTKRWNTVSRISRRAEDPVFCMLVGNVHQKWETLHMHPGYRRIMGS